jgi:hypothetical protein
MTMSSLYTFLNIAVVDLAYLYILTATVYGLYLAARAIINRYHHD